MIKKCLKFLNALSHSLLQSVMFFSRHSYKVSGTVIISYSVKMMNNPIVGKFFSVCLFPHRAMLRYITFTSRLTATTHEHIAVCYTPSTFPIWGLVTGRMPSLIKKTGFTISRTSANLLTASYAQVRLTFRLFTHEVKSMFVNGSSFIGMPILKPVFLLVNKRAIRAILLRTTSSLSWLITSLANHLFIHTISIHYLGSIINRHTWGGAKI